MRKWKVPRIWPKADVAIIGGGPSFKKMDVSILRDLSLQGKLRVIGVNKAYKEIPGSGEWIHILWFGDDIFYKIFSHRKKDGIYTFPGLRVGCCPSCERDKATKYLGRDKKKRWGITQKQTMVCWNKNSGASAINLAYHLVGPGGRVFLFGFDLKRGKREEGHWHPGYYEKRGKRAFKNPGPTDKLIASWVAPFNTIAKDAEKLGMEVHNVNPKSALECFPKIDFEQMVRMVEEREHVAEI